MLALDTDKVMAIDCRLVYMETLPEWQGCRKVCTICGADTCTLKGADVMDLRKQVHGE